MAIDINGVTIPNVPANVLVRYPSAVILKMTGSDGTIYVLLASVSAFGHAAGTVLGSTDYSELVGSFGAGRAYYAQADASVWDVGSGEVAAGELMLPVGTVDSTTVTLVWANHDVLEVTSLDTSTGDYTTDGVYFAQTADTSTVSGNNDANIYRIRRSRLAGIGDQVRRLTEVSPDLTPEEIEAMLAELDITLEEAYVTPSTEQQEIYPSVYGFSKVIVEAVEDSGGTGGGGGEGGDTISDATNTTFGNETVEKEVETGRFDYGDSGDGSKNVYPGIPDGKYRILLRAGLKLGTEFYVTVDGVPYKITANNPACVYYTHMYRSGSGHSYAVRGFSGDKYTNFYKYNLATGSSPSSTGTVNQSGYGHATTLWSSSTRMSVSGLPYYDLGNIGKYDDANPGLYGAAVACFAGETSPEDDTRIVIVSDSPLISDGVNINNEDGSPMTVYQYNPETDSWDTLETTTGSDYSIGSNEIIWNDHDIVNSETGETTFTASDPATPETSLETVTGPAERDDTYYVSSDSMNDLIAAAQKITGINEPMTPSQAAAALKEYYAGLNAG